MGSVDYLASEHAKDWHHVNIHANLCSQGCTLCFQFLLTG
jgi:hypothetical protein